MSSDAQAADHFGCSVAIDGDTAIVGAYGQDGGGQADAGAVYVFVRANGAWTEQRKVSGVNADDYFGYSVSLWGVTALVGAYGDDTTGDPDSTPDSLLVRKNVAGTDGGTTGADLIVERTGAAGADPGDFVGLIYRGTIADILSLTIEGSNDRETVTISDIGGLPDLSLIHISEPTRPY